MTPTPEQAAKLPRKDAVHLANAGKAALECGAQPTSRGPYERHDSNWTWKPENVTCKRCLAIHQTRVDGLMKARCG